MLRRLLLMSWLWFGGCRAATPAASVEDAEHQVIVKREVLAAFERACQAQAAPASTTPQVAPALDPPPAPPPVARAGPVLPSVFLEIAVFTVPSSLSKAQDLRRALAATPAARLVAAPHVSLEFERRVTLPFDEHTGPLAYPTLRAIAGTARLVSDGRLALELDVDLQLPTAPNTPPSAKPAATRARFVLGVPDREPVTATAALAGRTDEVAVMLLVAYVIREEADLRAIFECKMRNHQQKIERSR